MVKAGSRKDASVWGSQRNLDPSAGVTAPVTGVAAVPSELLAMQAGHSTVKDRARACVPIALRVPEPLRGRREIHGGSGRCFAWVLCEVVSLTCLGLAGQVCDVMSLAVRSSGRQKSGRQKQC